MNRGTVLESFGKFVIFLLVWMLAGSYIEDHIHQKSAAMALFGLVMYFLGWAGI
jgi:hypothetical protein